MPESLQITRSRPQIGSEGATWWTVARTGTLKALSGPSTWLNSKASGASPGLQIQQDPVASSGAVAAITTALAISSGGCMATPDLRKNSFTPSLSIPVSVVPGQMACAAMPSLARFGAMARIKPITPCLPIV